MGGLLLALFLSVFALVSWAPADFTISFLKNGRVYLQRAPSDEPSPMADAVSAALSPDGEKLVFTGAGTSRHPFYSAKVIDLGGGESEGELFRTLAKTTDLSWGPQSRRVAFILEGEDKTGNPTRSLAVSDLLDPQITVLVTLGDALWGKPIDELSAPAWGPDSQSLFFHDEDTLIRLGLDRQVLEKIPLDDIAGDGLSVTAEDVFAPSPKTDEAIAFSAVATGGDRTNSGSRRIYLYNTKTGGREALTPKNMDARHPAWSPDGEYLYFSGRAPVNDDWGRKAISIRCG